jgi:hypothetical protein
VRFAGSLEPLGRSNGDSSKIQRLAIRRTIRIGDHQDRRDNPDSLLELGLRHEVLPGGIHILFHLDRICRFLHVMLAAFRPRLYLTVFHYQLISIRPWTSNIIATSSHSDGLLPLLLSLECFLSKTIRGPSTLRWPYENIIPPVLVVLGRLKKGHRVSIL